MRAKSKRVSQKLALLLPGQQKEYQKSARYRYHHFLRIVVRIDCFIASADQQFATQMIQLQDGGF
jgi:hypothetical protein